MTTPTFHQTRQSGVPVSQDLRRVPPEGIDYVESSLEWENAFKQRILDDVHAQQWRLYPAPQPELARRRLGEHLGIDPTRIIFSSGADSAIDDAIRIAAHQGRHLFIPTPSYPGYDRSAYRHRARATHYPATLHPSSLSEQIGSQCALAIVTWPGNPLGLDSSPTLKPTDRVRWLIDATFLPPHSNHFAALLTANGDHSDIVFSFSKTAGIAGIRLGGTIHPEPTTQNHYDNGFPLDYLQLATANAITAAEALPQLHTRSLQMAAQQSRLLGLLHPLRAIRYSTATAFITIDGEPPNPDLHAKHFRDAGISRITTCAHNVDLLTRAGQVGSSRTATDRPNGHPDEFARRGTPKAQRSGLK